MLITGIKTPLFKEGGSLIEFLKGTIPPLQEGDILVITSKIISLSEGRVGKIKDKKKLIFEESKKTIPTPWGILTLTADGWGINAGIDESNAQDGIILLPKDPFKTASVIEKKLKKQCSLKKLGVLITDTRSLPLRSGTVGRAIGYAGFEPLKSYRGRKDLFGRKSRSTKTNHADALAAAAVMVMGEGNEQIPLALIEKAPVMFTTKLVSKKSASLAFPPENDIFSKIFTSKK